MISRVCRAAVNLSTEKSLWSASGSGNTSAGGESAPLVEREAIGELLVGFETQEVERAEPIGIGHLAARWAEDVRVLLV